MSDLRRDTRCRGNARRSRARGFVLGLVVISLGILSALGVGLLAVGFGARRQAVSVRTELAAMLAAEAGYEKAIFWMSRQQDMLTTLQQGAPGATGTATFPDSSCSYQVALFTFVGGRPVYRVLCRGESGAFSKVVDVLVVQAVSGWDMGMCRIPAGATETSEVNFASGETIEMPISINKLDDHPDRRDIYLWGRPDFQATVAMGESRHTSGGWDKYGPVMDLFDHGIHFSQPASKITDESSVQIKIDRFRASTKPQYRLTPTATAPVSNPQPAVQLEFFVQGNVGKVRVTDACTVRGFHQDSDWRTYDFRIQPGTNGQRYERYDIYAYHVVPEDVEQTGHQFVIDLEDTYVTQSFGGVDSAPGGQIFVNGNVIIGGPLTDHNNDQVVNGKITVAATGNIWIADSVYVDGTHDSGGKPALGNPNALGLLAQGVIKVVDPGLSLIDGIPDVADYEYVPIGRPDHPGASPPEEGRRGRRRREDNRDYFERHLPDPTVLEAAITVGGGGWGAENVQRGWYGGRKAHSGAQDYLVVRGSIAEAIRGVIGVIGADGYLKSYHMDQRLLAGILPGDIGLRGKFVPAPAGWRDYRPHD